MKQIFIFIQKSYTREEGEKFKYNGISKYNHAIPGDIVLDNKLIKNINIFLLTYVDLLMEMEELDLLFYSNPKLTSSLLQNQLQELLSSEDYNNFYEKKFLVDSIKER